MGRWYSADKDETKKVDMAGQIIHRAKKIVTSACSIDRYYYLVALSFLVAIVGLFVGWSKTPSSVSTVISSDGSLSIIDHISKYELIMKPILLAAYVYLFGKLLRGGLTDAVPRKLIVILMALVFVYPVYLNQWAPQYKQDNRIVFTSLERTVDDIDTTFNNQQVNWRRDHKLSNKFVLTQGWDYPPLYDGWSISLLNIALQTHVSIDILGLSNSFLSQVKLGWIFTVISLAMFIVSIYSYLGGSGKIILRDMLAGLAAFFIMIFVFIFPRYISELYLDKGDAYSSQGNYASAVKAWRSAAEWRPYISLDPSYQAKIGAALKIIGCNTCYETHLKNAYDYVTYRKYADALNEYKKAGLYGVDRLDLRYWLSSTYSDYAATLYNNGEYSLAEKYWKTSIAYVPVNASAQYGLSMVNLKFENYIESAKYMQNVREIQNHVTFKRLPVDAQLHLIRSWGEFRAGQLAAAHVEYWRYLDQ